MASHSANLNLEPVIWARLLEAQKRDISPELARYLLSIELRTATASGSGTWRNGPRPVL